MSTLVDELLKQQARVRDCLERAIALGAPGYFYAFVCRNALSNAEKAVAGGALAEIIRACKVLQDIPE